MHRHGREVGCGSECQSRVPQNAGNKYTHQIALGIHELAYVNRTPDTSFSIHSGSQFLLQAIIRCAKPVMFITYTSVFPRVSLLRIWRLVHGKESEMT